MASILEVKDLSFAYGKEKVLNNVNFKIDQGEFVILTGENGAAKTTLLKCCLGLLQPATGEVKMAEYNEKGNKLTIGYLPQTITSFNAGFPSTVQRLVESGRYSKGRWFKKLDGHDHAHVDKALESVGMTEYRNHKIGELSGGQKQRINLARIFAMNPDFFVLDEPTTGMDIASRTSFYDLLRHTAHVHGKTVLMVTHVDKELDGYYDREIRLVREEGSPWRCFSMISSSEHSQQV